MPNRRRHRIIKTKEQILAYRELDKAELQLEILISGISKRLEHFYGKAEKYSDLLHFMETTVRYAVEYAAQAEELVTKANLKAKKTKVVKATLKTKRTK